ncbi:hypothetical protein, partial [Thiolapillus sp.]|uniref:hypothetical protein n=2 Tax=Thiolapillus sp. TaxID=2017437 RepID=UPI003AF662F5
DTGNLGGQGLRLDILFHEIEPECQRQATPASFDHLQQANGRACLRPRERFWDIPVPKIDSAFDNLFVPQPSWSPSTTQQLRKLVAAPYLAPNDWTPRSEAYFVFPLAQGTPGKQCGLAATGDYQPSLRSPWLAANDILRPGISRLVEFGGMIVKEAATKNLAPCLVVDGIIQRHQQPALDSRIGNLFPEHLLMY